MLASIAIRSRGALSRIMLTRHGLAKPYLPLLQMTARPFHLPTFQQLQLDQSICDFQKVQEPDWEDVEESELSIVEEDGAAPCYQMIQTYDRKKLKMKKHRRQKRKKLLRTKLKWSGKL